MGLVLGSTSTGFAGLVDLNLTLEGDVYGPVAIREGDAKVAGTAWCLGDGAAGAPAAAMPGPATDGGAPLATVARTLPAMRVP
jgi:hypothetical protein